MEKILLDTDIGCDMDDMQALAYLLARDDVKLLGITTVRGGFSPDVRGIIILAILVAIALVWKKLKKKKPSPILMILISAELGMLIYSV